MTHTTTNDKSPSPSTITGDSVNHPNSANPPTTGHQAEAIATRLAKLALAGHVVHKGQSGDFLVCKHGLSRYCQDQTELQAFARQLGGGL